MYKRAGDVSKRKCVYCRGAMITLIYNLTLYLILIQLFHINTLPGTMQNASLTLRQLFFHQHANSL